MVLVDTSVWIDEFRGAFRLADVVDLSEIAVCPPVLLEVLRGARGARLYKEWRAALVRAQMLDDPMPSELFEHAAGIYRTCQDEGVTISSMGDLLIATCAIRHNVPLLTLDGGFRFVAQIVPLQLFAAA